MILYFSGCGNSGWVAHEMAHRLGQQLLFVPDLLRKGTPVRVPADESLGFVFPVYAWTPPRFFMEVLPLLSVEGRPRYVFMTCTCGDEVGQTVEVLRKALQRVGLRLDAAFSLTMPETYINLPGFKLDSPEGERRKVESARERLDDVVARVARCEASEDVVVGKMAWLKSHPVNWLFNRFLITDRFFRATEACVGCGRCASACPAQNVVLSADAPARPRWQGHCWGCMACYHHCPVNAIHFGRFTDGKGQYFFGHGQA
ncbi:MAG: EFR1 family ferrodoxin [Bacteroidales bacterium]|nr:EFR1 family ferrodoxin [Bacteroidales bacterium]